jgi:hypothetical protein
MFVLCDNCNNHYDDTAQSKKCVGPGRKAGSMDGRDTSHIQVTSRPIDDHLAAIRSRSGGRVAGKGVRNTGTTPLALAPPLDV